jgi:hypothetical protein
MSFPEDHVLADCVCHRIHRSGGFGCALVRVHAHVAEIVPKTRREKRARPGVERLPRGPQDLVYNGRRRARSWTHSPSLQ